MANKQLIHAYVEPDVYLSLKSREINLSRTVNDLLREFLGATKLNKDEAEVERKLREQEKTVEKALRKQAKLTAELSAIRQSKMQEQEEWLKQAMKVQEAMHLNNPMRNL